MRVKYKIKEVREIILPAGYEGFIVTFNAQNIPDSRKYDLVAEKLVADFCCDYYSGSRTNATGLGVDIDIDNTDQRVHYSMRWADSTEPLNWLYIPYDIYMKMKNPTIRRLK